MKERVIFHIDVNNAFLSWSAVWMLKNGYRVDIRNRFAVIGGDEKQRRGIVLAKSIPAKQMGILTGESLYMARKKCPSLEVYPPNFKIYSYYSNLMFKYLQKYSDKIERYSVDECFIDYTDSVNLFGDPLEVAYKIKNDIKDILGFTVNVGIGKNKLCAKMASDFSKPDKVHTLFPYEIKEKMWPLSVAELFMIGRKTSDKLINLGIKTIGDLAQTDNKLLVDIFKSMGNIMYEYANGIDNSKVEYEYDGPKSISSSSVLPYDYSDLGELLKVVRILSIDVARRLRKQNKTASVIYVSLKYGDFTKNSRQLKLDREINSDNDLFNNFVLLFKCVWNFQPVRNVCVGVSNFKNVGTLQLSLFENNEKIDQNSDVQNIVDELRDKFGNDKIIYADMLKKK